ncbi:MAG: SDR family oxidoreductase [Planctomycetota bacterium]
MARHFASLGCHVALHANTSVDDARLAAAAIESEFGVRSIVTIGDVSDEATSRKIVLQAVDAFEKLDVFVNSAAIWSPSKLEDITADELRRYFEINAVGSFLGAKAAGLQMVHQPHGGAIINIGDWATSRPYLDHAAYFPSKGSVETMTRSLAVELGCRNPKVRVNCVQPGPVLLTEDADQAVVDRLVTSTLANRIGTPGDVAHAVQMLCENSFITGVCLPVDGGRTVFSPDGLQSGHNTG